MRIIFSLILLLGLGFTVDARQKTYDFNSRCEQAYEAIMELRLNAGKALLEAEKKENPDNLVPYFLDNYVDFFPLFFNEDRHALHPAGQDAGRITGFSLLSVHTGSYQVSMGDDQNQVQ